MKYNKSLFIFRRDLRLEDNTGLIDTLKNSRIVIPCFIFTQEQIDDNPYRSDRCLQFMIECLEDLALELNHKNGKLYLFYGPPDKVVEKLIKTLSIDNVAVNRDYTPYSEQRDQTLAAVCKKRHIPFSQFHDALLNPPEETLKRDGKPYIIFTPYFRNASKIEVQKPEKNHAFNYFNGNIDFANNEALFEKILPKRSSKAFVRGGREEGLKILNKIGQYAQYAAERDFPFQEGTTHLSAYLKFTVLSPREVYQSIAERLGINHELIRALYWRDFFSDIAFFFPYVFQGAFHSKYNALKWNSDEKIFEKWCQGKTGFPIVDAGMKEMNETGFMHNRVRMITASFLTKDLHINWQWGERYFAQKLIDYDPAVNNGNWQWTASTGCDAQPYFRIFNPWNQQEKFDPDCEYIKKWIPELRSLSSKTIHQWHQEKHDSNDVAYPRPIVDHSIEAKIALDRYRAVVE